MTSETTAVEGGADTLAVLERIRALSASMSSAEQRVARQVLRDPAAVIHQSVNELAQAAGTSPATVVRFCQGLALRGYQELKLALIRETLPHDRQLVDEVSVDDGPDKIIRKVLGGAASALTEAARSIDSAALATIADLVVAAPRTLFVAVGTSAPLAMDTAYRLTTVGVDARFAGDAHVQHVTARMLAVGDVCIAISHTGSTVETLAAVRAAVDAGAHTAAITSFVRSPLTELVRHTVVAGSRETAYRIEAMTSRIVHLSVLDALFALVVHSPCSRDALAMTADVLIEHRI
ncbi:MurR/RpiR family transcriptional regulator [Candidatus Protofrankia californiensis]|uniref:MurR/RpiR family transcriptional regulator n=1 Tax=Candidatus Protofrankia californiensis TaxID=1839754 RepID=UPI001041949C|nr:MurR/RpiR family transcriptional regulator [Candidatus Protofrankia californiensis]